MKQPIGPELPGTRQALLTFPKTSIRSRDYHGRTVETYSEVAQLPFLPKGLMLWGSTVDTFVHSVMVGNMREVDIGGHEPIPGRYFEQGHSFEDIQRLAEAGELEISVEARQQFEMTEAGAGVHVTVALSGPYDRFVVWGLTYANAGMPHRRAVVQKLDSSERYSGRLDIVSLSGIRTVLEVTAPDARTAGELLVGLNTAASRY